MRVGVKRLKRIKFHGDGICGIGASRPVRYLCPVAPAFVLITDYAYQYNYLGFAFFNYIPARARNLYYSCGSRKRKGGNSRDGDKGGKARYLSPANEAPLYATLLMLHV